jgi:hypothetical protein
MDANSSATIRSARNRKAPQAVIAAPFQRVSHDRSARQGAKSSGAGFNYTASTMRHKMAARPGATQGRTTGRQTRCAHHILDLLLDSFALTHGRLRTLWSWWTLYASGWWLVMSAWLFGHQPEKGNAYALYASNRGTAENHPSVWYERIMARRDSSRTSPDGIEESHRDHTTLCDLSFMMWILTIRIQPGQPAEWDGAARHRWTDPPCTPGVPCAP